jgi:hypothetical protein
MTDYNGWTNWATWNVYVWLTNDEAVYRAAHEAAHEDNVPKLTALALHWTRAVSGDGVNLREVDWPEIVAGLKEE